MKGEQIMFMNELKATLNNEFNTSVTENGALGYKTTGKELLDMNFSVSSMRNMTEQQIVDKFVKAFYEDKLLAVKWLFYARDVREGIGERRLFRVCLKYLAEQHPEIAAVVIPLIPKYGRWDDLWCLLDTQLRDNVLELVLQQLNDDANNYVNNQSISLLAKWLPSINTSSEETKRLARIIIKGLCFKSERQYRKTLSMLRSYLKVVEVDMSAKRWDVIDYAAVPSRANLIYNDAFLKNDEERRRGYLEALQKGETKINAGVLFPHDIVHKYCGGCRAPYSENTTLEELWKALPDYVQGSGNTICVADGSGSMGSTVGNTGVTALEVANALAIYFSERSSGQFKDQYITFSENPQIVNFQNAKSLKEKLEIASHYIEVADTNIEAVFDLILTTAVKKHMTQDELPSNILILSDMEFNECVFVQDGTETYRDWWSGQIKTRPRLVKPSGKLFNILAKRYAEHGYKLPRLVFWNICSRTGTIPVKENDLGVALVSGFSPAIAKMVLSNSTDPFECLLEQLNAERYEPVELALQLVL